jgi:hypothetical protein
MLFNEVKLLAEPVAVSSVALKMIEMAPVLTGLDQAEASKLLKFGRKASWKQDERVFYQGADADEMFILLGGQLIVWLDAVGIEKPIATLKPGNNFGEMAILAGGKRGANVSAVVPSFGISVNTGMLKNFPNIGLVIYKNIARVALERQNMVNAKAAEAPKAEAPKEEAKTA